MIRSTTIHTAYTFALAQVTHQKSRGRGRETERERDRDRERQRETETERETDRDRESEREREKERQVDGGEIVNDVEAISVIFIQVSLFAYLGFRRCRANMANSVQSKLDHGLGFQVNILKTFQGVDSLRGSSFGFRTLNHQP